MINLIPPEAEKVLKREYMLRVSGTLGFLLGAVMIVLTVALVPTYVLIGAQMSNSIQDEATKEEDTLFQAADQEVKLAGTLIRQLKGRVETAPISSAIEEIQKTAPLGITFRVFSVSDIQGVVTQITVQGVASTREVLAGLKTKIEESHMFDKAEIPISDLARDTNLPFTITVTPSRKP